MDADCCGLCCLCVTCFGLVDSAFRYLPFQSVFKSCTCRCCKNRDDDFDNINFPAHNPEFTPDGERINPYAPPMPMRVQRPEEADDPYAPPPPLPQGSSPYPPGYPTAQSLPALNAAPAPPSSPVPTLVSLRLLTAAHPHPRLASPHEQLSRADAGLLGRADSDAGVPYGDDAPPRAAHGGHHERVRKRRVETGLKCTSDR
ncbi:hypothetical protein C8R44DRAFT_889340 [Mycena epipterygia]|nr:hypothetical protein C8R44DRAFT_889340 [Mycena epipterygia]